MISHDQRRPGSFRQSCKLRRFWLRSSLLGGLALASVGLFPSAAGAQSPSYSVRFYGNGVSDIDRVKIRVDDPYNSNDEPGPPVDVGATDFTMEFWLKGTLIDNRAASIACGSGNFSWISGNIVVDRDRFSSGGRDFGISLANGGRIAFGVENTTGQNHTLCGTINVLDGAWHHVAVERRRNDGQLWIFVDGQLDAQAGGPNGDISYPGASFPDSNCGGPCVDSDPFIVIGAEKHDYDRTNYPSFSGFFDELRISRTLRYLAAFSRPGSAFAPDALTAGLYHFDDGPGAPVAADAATVAGAPTNGEVRYGGSPAGPAWSSDTPFSSSSCSYVVSPTNVTAPATGATGLVSVTTASGCAWNSVSNASWVTISSGASGSGNGNMNYVVAANSSASPRSSSVAMAGSTVSFTQAAACVFAVSPVNQTLAAGGGITSLSVTAPGGCGWTAVSNASWLKVTSGGSGSGNGTVSLTATPNVSGASRVASVTVAGQVATIAQPGFVAPASPSNLRIVPDL